MADSIINMNAAAHHHGESNHLNSLSSLSSSSSSSSSPNPTTTTTNSTNNNTTNSTANSMNHHHHHVMVSHLSPANRSKFKVQLSHLRDHLTVQRNRLTLFSQPISTVRYFVQECHVQLVRCIHFCLVRHLFWTVALLSLASLLIMLRCIDGVHRPVYDTYWNSSYVALEWIVLGVLSSVGLGTGLHTFLLYLGPFIAQVTMAANECGTTDFALHGPNAFLCPPSSSSSSSSSSMAAATLLASSIVSNVVNNNNNTIASASITTNTNTNDIISFWTIVHKVQFAALCWGLGTAIGELPPYFVARAARLAGKMQESVEDEDYDSDIDDDVESSSGEVGGGSSSSGGHRGQYDHTSRVNDGSNGDASSSCSTPPLSPVSPMANTVAASQFTAANITIVKRKTTQQSNAVKSVVPSSQKRMEKDGGTNQEEQQQQEERKPLWRRISAKFSPRAMIHRLSTRVKPLLTHVVQHYAFVAILLLSSIPNPLFDLAGITCGYSLIPFWTFFGATIIGKAVVKAHLQSILVVVVFSKRTLDWIVNEIEYHMPQGFKGHASQFFESERRRFHPDSTPGAHTSANSGHQVSLFKLLWDMLLFGMIAYFVISIINSTAQSRITREHKIEIEQFKETTLTSLIENQKE